MAAQRIAPTGNAFSLRHFGTGPIIGALARTMAPRHIGVGATGRHELDNPVPARCGPAADPLMGAWRHRGTGGVMAFSGIATPAPQANGAWYVVQTKPHHEERATANLQGMGVHTFLPRVHVAGGARRGRLVQPLFPRYLFVRCNILTLGQKIAYTRGVSRVLGNDAGPLAVDDEVVELIRNRAGADGVIAIAPTFCIGQRVRVAAGPFKDFVGVFAAELRPSDRVAILIRTVSNPVRVIVDRHDLAHLGGEAVVDE
jgi:transcriptional antiterminator RfaH